MPGVQRLRINAYLEVGADDAGTPVIQCTCGETLGPASQSYKTFALEARRPLAALGPSYAPGQGGEARFEIREYYCPSCLVLLDTDVALKDDAVVHDVELSTEMPKRAP